MNPENPPTIRSRLLQGVAGLLGAFILYVLSIGPVGYVFDRWQLNPGQAGKIYIPLEWLMFNTPLKAPLVPYVRWWVDLAQSHREADRK